MKLTDENYNYLNRYFLISGTGFEGFLNKGFVDSEIIITNVLDNSISFNKGIQIGDELIKINNKYISKIDFFKLNKMFILNDLSYLTFKDKEVSFSRDELKKEHFIKRNDFDNFLNNINENFDIQTLINFDYCLFEIKNLNLEINEINEFLKFNNDAKNLEKFKKLIEYANLKLKKNSIETALNSNNVVVLEKK